MGLRIVSLFMFALLPFQSIACDLHPYKIVELYMLAPHEIADIECSKEEPDNYVYRNVGERASSEDQLLFIEKVLAKTNLEYDDVRIDEKGILRWTITNDRYMKGPGQRGLASIEDKPKKKTHAFYVEFYSGAVNISSTDLTSNVSEKAFSKMSNAINVVWSHLWTDNVSYFFVGSLKRHDFEVSNNRTISDTNVIQHYIGTSLRFKLSDRISLSPGLGLGQSLILSSSGANITSNISRFPSSSGDLYFKAFMTSDTTQACRLDSISIGTSD